MELYPSDLGKLRYLALLRRRAWVGMYQNSARGGTGFAASSVTFTSDDIKASKHPFLPFWTQDLRVRDDETRAKAAMVAQSGGNGVGMTLASIFSATHLTVPLGVWAAFSGHPELSVLLAGAWGAGVWSMWRHAPRRWLRKMDAQGLTAVEIESLLPAARGNLERQYLSLALDALKIRVPTETARAEIGASLAALGEAVSALPGDPPTSGVTAVVYKNALLQVAHLRDVVASFDSGMSAALAGGAINEATAAIDRLGGEAASHAEARRELEDELGASLFATLSGVPGAAAGKTVPAQTPTTAANVSPAPVTQPVGVGTGGGAKWWQQRTP